MSYLISKGVVPVKYMHDGGIEFGQPDYDDADKYVEPIYETDSLIDAERKFDSERAKLSCFMSTKDFYPSTVITLQEVHDDNGDKVYELCDIASDVILFGEDWNQECAIAFTYRKNSTPRTAFYCSHPLNVLKNYMTDDIRANMSYAKYIISDESRVVFSAELDQNNSEYFWCATNY